MRRTIVVLLTGIALAGCTTPEGRRITAKVERTTDENGWRVDCNYDETSDMRRCFVGGFGETSYGEEKPFQVSYFNETGPMVTLFSHDDPSTKAIVRVDDNEPVRLTNLNRYMTGTTGKARIRESKRLIVQLKSGNVARVRTVDFPSDYADFKVDLDGFSAAYERLQDKLKENS